MWGAIRFRDRLRGILTVKDSPHRVAMSFAVGLFIGISPFFGLHILLGLAIAWMLNLNRAVLIAAVLVTNPWTVIPVYSFCLWVGLYVMGRSLDVPELDWSLFTVTNMIDGLGQMFLPILVGTAIVGLAASVLSYFAVYGAACRFRDREHGKGCGCDDDEEDKG